MKFYLNTPCVRLRIENGKVVESNVENVLYFPCYYGLITDGYKQFSFDINETHLGVKPYTFRPGQFVGDLHVILARFDLDNKSVAMPCGPYTFEEVQLWRHSVSNEIISVHTATDFPECHDIPVNVDRRFGEMSLNDYVNNKVLWEHSEYFKELLKTHTVEKVLDLYFMISEDSDDYLNDFEEMRKLWSNN